MKLGFTGTQNGMTKEQMVAVANILDIQPSIEVHHGDCVGADEDFNKLASERGFIIVTHPCVIKNKRAYCMAYYEHTPKPPLERNKDIVAAVDILIATPKEFNEVLRSGTWATIRYARDKGIPTFVINPNGIVREYGKKET